jgi:Ca2+-binding EF-hand superfamily protein
VTEQKAVIAELMRRYDANHDGSLSRAEMMPILRDFLETDKFPDRGVRWDLRRRVLVLKYFDVNNDGFVDPVEDAVSDSVIKAARQKNRPDNEALRLGTNWPWG